MSSSEFSAWAEECELETDTVELLISLGFKSYKALRRIDAEMSKKLFAKNLSPGQFVLLEAGLEMLHLPAPAPETTTTSAATTAPPPGTDSAITLDTLLSRLPQLDTNPIQNGLQLRGGEVPTDPFCFGTGPFSAKKLRAITDHVTCQSAHELYFPLNATSSTTRSQNAHDPHPPRGSAMVGQQLAAATAMAAHMATAAASTQHLNR